ncbi:MAG: MotA/TolQ/ExbB proton channel family protein, partial [Solirubrobacterales bacterium]
MNFLLAASLGDTITDAVAEVAKALRYPVLILALLALLAVTFELCRLGVEAYRRSQRNKDRFDNLGRHALQLARAGDSAGAQAVIRSYAYGGELQRAAVGTLFASNPVDAQRAVVDYDLYVSKRLDRVRLLVRSGPALGLMGTLIPLAPALAALGKGDSKVLADELQTAFAITVVGVAIGLIAFTVALFHERFYTKDLADLEFLREIRGDATSTQAATAPQPAASVPAHQASTDQADVTAAQTAVSPA